MSSDVLERIEGVLAAVNETHVQLLVREAEQLQLNQKLATEIQELADLKDGLESVMAWIISRYSQLALEKTLKQVVAEAEQEQRKSGGKREWAIQ